MSDTPTTAPNPFNSDITGNLDIGTWRTPAAEQKLSARIAQLERENGRLREALEQIKTSWSTIGMQRVARAALAGEEGK